MLVLYICVLPPDLLRSLYWRSLLDLGWSYPADIWSCGCILAELAMGTELSPAKNQLDQLAMMERVSGSRPRGGAAATTQVC